MYLRADGDNTTGLGHIYRLLAMAEIANVFFECYFLVRKNATDIVSKIIGDTCKVISLNEDIDAPASKNIVPGVDKHDIIVLDGYGFDTAFQQAVKRNFQCKLVSVDDIHSYPFLSDLVINPSGGIDPGIYNVSPGTQLLTGPAYAILRQPFYKRKARRKPSHTINHVLICFGGADPGDHTLQTLKQVHAGNPETRFSVIVGKAYQHLTALKAYADPFSNIKVYFGLNVDELIDIMQQCDTAICSASTVAYEYASISGLLLVKKTADNQEGIYQFLLKEGLALPEANVGKCFIGNNVQSLRDQQVQQQQKYFDGSAGNRLLKELKKLYLRNNIKIRKAETSDVDLYYRWANDEEVRRNSFSSEAIPYEAHCAWFSDNLSSPDAVFYVVTTTADTPAGSIRFKIHEDKAELSYLVDPLFRNGGLGEIILREGAARLFEERKDISVIEGLVKYVNIASLKAFIAAGFSALPYEKKGINLFQLKRAYAQ